MGLTELKPNVSSVFLLEHQGNLFLLAFFPASKSTHIPWLLAPVPCPSSNPAAADQVFLTSYHSDTDIFASPFPFKDPCDYIGSTQMIQRLAD